jgi:transposase
MRGRRVRRELEQRRLKAGRLLSKGVSQAEVARRMEVSRETVRRWADKLSDGGLVALKNAPKLGRPAGLAPAQRQELVRALKAGALAQGYATELWTLPRVTALIDTLFGRRYSQVQVWRILGQLGWSSQRPTGRATQRDERAIRQWKRERWPALKKTLPDKDVPSSS